MENFLEKIINNKPYRYQLEVANKLLSGKNVILSVPTGAGKTWAAIAPFLYAQKYPEIPFPRKMIYSSPLRTLTNSIYEDVLKSKFVNEAAIQTGEFNDDIYFDKDIVFSTIDQTLSNFLCFPLPLSQAQANINAGALTGKIDFFDTKNKVVHETKRSNKVEQAHIWQVKFYLWLLELNGIETEKGIIEYPKLREREEVFLDEEDINYLKKTIENIKTLVKQTNCPPVINARICKSCSYYDFCYAGE